MIVLGLILLIIGFVAKIAILWTIGIIVLVIGLILALLGAVDTPSVAVATITDALSVLFDAAGRRIRSGGLLL